MWEQGNHWREQELNKGCRQKAEKKYMSPHGGIWEQSGHGDQGPRLREKCLWFPVSCMWSLGSLWFTPWWRSELRGVYLGTWDLERGNEQEGKRGEGPDLWEIMLHILFTYEIGSPPSLICIRTSALLNLKQRHSWFPLSSKPMSLICKSPPGHHSTLLCLGKLGLVE